jgi:hypothetical protein
MFWVVEGFSHDSLSSSLQRGQERRRVICLMDKVIKLFIIFLDD